MNTYNRVFFNDTATTEIYTLSLHDALPISHGLDRFFSSLYAKPVPGLAFFALSLVSVQQRRSFPIQLEQVLRRSEEHTSELQSRQYLVCRLLLEKNTTNQTSC